MPSIKIPLPAGGSVSGILETAPSPRAAIALAHGAGAGMRHPFMEALAHALVAAGFTVLRYQFPYMEEGSKRPDPPKVAIATVSAAAAELARRAPGLPLYAAGKSFGARMSTQAAAEGRLTSVRGIICFGFPLHPAGEPSTKRAEHLASVKVPILFLQGTRDELADLELMRGVCSKLKLARLYVIAHADHGFAVLKRSGRTNEEALGELVRETSSFAG